MASTTSSPYQVSGFYEQDGYVIAKNIFSNSALAALAGSLRSVLESSGTSGEGFPTTDELILAREAQDHGLVYNAAQSVGSSAATYELIGGSGILDAVCSVTGFKKARLHLLPLYLIIQLPSDERFDYTWHQDGAYYPWCKEFLTLWFPVNRSTNKDSGTISMIPGSHREGRRDVDKSLRHGFFKQLESKLDQNEEQKEAPLDIQLGDCCIMDGNTVHRSVANRSKTPRVAGVLRMAHLSADQAYERESFYCVHKS
jgi:ectoine hydroxylase-related dioxygenase (phytanoyl-CoA dioxygenase family)